jgi:calcium/calmodulin-dependent protein kinase I
MKLMQTFINRGKYKFGRTLGAGTYGVVREAEGPTGKVAVKIILKKNVKGNERMVYDELQMLQRLKHPHIVKFVDWFESRVRSSSFVPQLGHHYPFRALRLTEAPCVGQVLYCYRACHRRRALRENLRTREIYRKGCFPNN